MRQTNCSQRVNVSFLQGLASNVHKSMACCMQGNTLMLEPMDIGNHWTQRRRSHARIGLSNASRARPHSRRRLRNNSQQNTEDGRAGGGGAPGLSYPSSGFCEHYLRRGWKFTPVNAPGRLGPPERSSRPSAKFSFVFATQSCNLS